jgi:tetratricopeptide (TPR) repeat protein
VTWLALFLGVLLAAGVSAAVARRRSPSPAAATGDDGLELAERELAGLREQLADGELTETEYRLLRDRLAAQLAAPPRREPPAAPRSALWIGAMALAALTAVVLVVPSLRERLPGMSPTGNDFTGQAAPREPPELTAERFAELLRRARELDDAGRLAEALPIYRMAVVVAPNQADFRVRLGFALARAGREREGLSELRRAVRTDPRFAPARLYLGAVLLNRGERVEARAQLRRYLELAPEGAGARLARRLLRLSS